MQITNKFKVIIVVLLALVVLLSYLANRFNESSEQSSVADTHYYSDQDKVDSYNKEKRGEAMRKGFLDQEAQITIRSRIND